MHPTSLATDITALFLCLDDFCKLYEKTIREQALPSLLKDHRSRQGLLNLSELMFIEVLYHFSPFKEFKRFYRFGLCVEHRLCFKELSSYQHLVALKKKLLAYEFSPLFRFWGADRALFCWLNKDKSLPK